MLSQPGRKSPALHLIPGLIVQPATPRNLQVLGCSEMTRDGFTMITDHAVLPRIAIAFDFCGADGRPAILGATCVNCQAVDENEAAFMSTWEFLRESDECTSAIESLVVGLEQHGHVSPRSPGRMSAPSER